MLSPDIGKAQDRRGSRLDESVQVDKWNFSFECGNGPLGSGQGVSRDQHASCERRSSRKQESPRQSATRLHQFWSTGQFQTQPQADGFRKASPSTCFNPISAYRRTHAFVLWPRRVESSHQVWTAGILRGPWPRELVVIRQRAETATQQRSRRRVAHTREGGIVTDRPAVAHDAQYRWACYIVQHGQGSAHVTAGSQLLLRDCGSVPRRNVTLGPWSNCIERCDHSIALRSISPASAWRWSIVPSLRSTSR